MRRFAYVLLGCVVGAGVSAYCFYEAGMVYANRPQSSSEFFRSYDPKPVLARFGALGMGTEGVSSGSGWRVATRSREITQVVTLPATEVAALTAALKEDVASKLQKEARQVGRSESAGETSFEYQTHDVWGYFILERIEPEPPTARSPVAAWRVRMTLIERWHG